MLRNVQKSVYSAVGLGSFKSFIIVHNFVTSPSSSFGNMLYLGPAASMLPHLMTKGKQTWHST
jgi:hypothetical protein